MKDEAPQGQQPQLFTTIDNAVRIPYDFHWKQQPNTDPMAGDQFRLARLLH